MTPPQIRPKGRESILFFSDSYTGSIPDAYDFGDTSVKNGYFIRILDTNNEDGIYNRGKDEVLKVNVENGVETTTTRLRLDSKEGKAAVKDFKKKYGIDLNLKGFKGQFNLFNAKVYVENIDGARADVAKGRSKDAIRHLDSADKAAGEADLQLDGDLQKKILRDVFASNVCRYRGGQIQLRNKEYPGEESSIDLRLERSELEMLMLSGFSIEMEGKRMAKEMDEEINTLLEKRQKEGLTDRENLCLTSKIEFKMDGYKFEMRGVLKHIEDLNQLLVELEEDLK